MLLFIVLLGLTNIGVSIAIRIIQFRGVNTEFEWIFAIIRKKLIVHIKNDVNRIGRPKAVTAIPIFLGN